MRKLLTLLTLTVSFVAWIGTTGSFAQSMQRQLPQNGKRGFTGEKLLYPMVRISRENLRLAPGGLIFNHENRAILHQSLPANVDVWYQTNPGGEVQRIYILTPVERAALDKAGK